jgi:hypothetical protein
MLGYFLYQTDMHIRHQGSGIAPALAGCPRKQGRGIGEQKAESGDCDAMIP